MPRSNSAGRGNCRSGSMMNFDSRLTHARDLPEVLARESSPVTFQPGRAVSTSPEEWMTPSASSRVSSSSDRPQQSASTSRVCCANRGAGAAHPRCRRGRSGTARRRRARPAPTSHEHAALRGPRRVGELLHGAHLGHQEPETARSAPPRWGSRGTRATSPARMRHASPRVTWRARPRRRRWRRRSPPVDRSGHP